MAPENGQWPGRLGFNARTLSAPHSGVQRYAHELAHRFAPQAEFISPPARAQGIRGHLWEQLVLPGRLRGGLLFSPANTGPLACSRQVVTMHDASVFDHPEAFAGMFGNWYRWLLPRLAARVARVVTVSRFSRDRLAGHLGMDPEKISVVHNGVGKPVGRANPDRDRRALESLRLPRRFLLFVGNRDPRKNLTGLLEAFARVESRLGDLRLVVVGGGNARLFRDQIPAGATPERVWVPGRVTDQQLHALYRTAEGFVFPSVYEGFGLPPLEAMAHGCPVLCADSSCLPEVCGPDLAQGGAPVYFAAGHVAALSQALVEFAASPPAVREAMRAAGRRRASQFSWDRCARETERVLHDVARARISNRRRHPTPSSSAATSQP